MEPTDKQHMRRLLTKQGVLRSRELESQGIARAAMAHCVEDGLLVRVARGSMPELLTRLKRITPSCTWPSASRQPSSACSRHLV